MPGLLPRFHGPGPGRQRAGRQRQLGAATGDDHGDGLPAVPGRGVAALPGHETCGENAGFEPEPPRKIGFIFPWNLWNNWENSKRNNSELMIKNGRFSAGVLLWQVGISQRDNMVLWNMGLLRDAWVSQRVGEWRITRWNLEKHLMHLLGDYKCDNLKVLFASKHTFIRSI